MGNIRRSARTFIRTPDETVPVGTQVTTQASAAEMLSPLAEGALEAVDAYKGEQAEVEVIKQIEPIKQQFVKDFEGTDLDADIESQLQQVDPADRKQVEAVIAEKRQAVRQGLVPERAMLLEAQNVLTQALAKTNRRYHDRVRRAVTGQLGRDVETALIDLLVQEGRQSVETEQQIADWKAKTVQGWIAKGDYPFVTAAGGTVDEMYNNFTEAMVADKAKKTADEKAQAEADRLTAQKNASIDEVKQSAEIGLNQFALKAKQRATQLYNRYALHLGQIADPAQRMQAAQEFEQMIKQMIHTDKITLSTLAGQYRRANAAAGEAVNSALAFAEQDLDKHITVFNTSDEQLARITKWNDITKQWNTQDRLASTNWLLDPDNQDIGASIINAFASLAITKDPELMEAFGDEIGSALTQMLLDDKKDTASGIIRHLDALTKDLVNSRGEVPDPQLTDTFYKAYDDLIVDYRNGNLEENEVASFALMAGRIASSLIAGESRQWEAMVNRISDPEFQEILEQAPELQKEFAKRSITSAVGAYFLNESNVGNRISQILQQTFSDKVKIGMVNGKAKVMFDPDNPDHYTEQDKRYGLQPAAYYKAGDRRSKHYTGQQWIENFINQSVDAIWANREFDPVLGKINSKEELLDFMLHGDAGNPEEGQTAFGGFLRKGGYTVKKKASIINRGLSLEEGSAKAEMELAEEMAKTKTQIDEARLQSQREVEDLMKQLTNYKKEVEEGKKEKKDLLAQLQAAEQAKIDQAANSNLPIGMRGLIAAFKKDPTLIDLSTDDIIGTIGNVE